MMLTSQKPREVKGGKRRIWSTNAVSFLIRTNSGPLDLTIRISLNRVT